MDPLSVQRAIHKKAIGKTMILYILPILFLLAVLTNISFYYLKKVNNSYSDLIDRRAHVLNAINDLQVHIFEEDTLIRDYLLINNKNGLHEFYFLSNQLDQEITNVIGLSKRASVKENLKKIMDTHKNYKQEVEEILNLSLKSHDDAIGLFELKAVLLTKEMIKDLHTLSKDQLSYMDGISDSNDELVKYSTTAIISTGILGFLIACVYINYISKSPLMKIKILEK